MLASTEERGLGVILQPEMCVLNQVMKYLHW